MQADCPVKLLYVPAAQLKHADAFVEPVFGLYVPIGHSVAPELLVEKIVGLSVQYVPVGHSAQAPPLSRYSPSKHTIEPLAMQETLPHTLEDEYVLVGQFPVVEESFGSSYFSAVVL